MKRGYSLLYLIKRSKKSSSPSLMLGLLWEFSLIKDRFTEWIDACCHCSGCIHTEGSVEIFNSGFLIYQNKDTTEFKAPHPIDEKILRIGKHFVRFCHLSSFFLRIRLIRESVIPNTNQKSDSNAQNDRHFKPKMFFFHTLSFLFSFVFVYVSYLFNDVICIRDFKFNIKGA